MARMVDRNCECCRAPMRVRAADVARGWGRYCSKRCKARAQESRTGQHARREHAAIMADVEVGWDAHKESF